jgi:cellulose synthase operon protein C
MLAALALTLAVHGAAPASLEQAYLRMRALEAQIARQARPHVVHGWAREMARTLVQARRITGASGDEQTLVRAMDESVERVLSNLAVNLHNLAKRTKAREHAVLASDIYGDYLALFADDGKAYDLRFFRAELLNDNLDDHRRAAPEYTAVLEQDVRRRAEGQQPGRWMEHAAYNAVLAYKEVAKKAEKDEATRDAAPKKKLPIPPAKKDLLLACQRYLEYLPQGDKVVDLTWEAGFVLYHYNYFEQAVPLLADIALNHPEHDLAEVSANLILDVYNLLADWPKLREWARKLQSIPKLGRPEFKEDLAKKPELADQKLGR